MSLSNADLENIGEMMDKRFMEQDRKWDERLDRRFSRYTRELLEVVATKDDLKETLDDFRKEIREEFRTRITAVQDAVVRFHQEWQMSAPPLVDEKFKEVDRRLNALEES